ncbi:MAG: hypothetical protein A2469_00495 [Candidatus Magasanikbacteria bacterium RIFOXYC2_FULL_40_16]|uniref:Major facilitator superfamily (MFS) profile domain-containing protein n=1 Tax=Candidatus Magasanikbacteria bacterium RIFOXYC2_FULL_40_16 TaxID=1798703 RepID=A0A1F6P1Q5_9BACT|nr:MAG: hypothetical protein A2469_00495 [Candidatus Magasanikbacteria bacterium RIFOXYC2_FULL_40_16]
MYTKPKKMKYLFLNDINPVIRFLIISDVVIIGAGGLLGPIFAIFVEDFVVGGNEVVVGIAAAIYLSTKSVLQIPTAHMIDRIKGERDDFWLMFIFSILSALIPLFYLIVRTPFELYAVQFLLGLFTSITFPTYMAIFTRHIDKHKEATEWGVYFTIIDITSAVLAALGGFVAGYFGFQVLICMVVFLSVVGSLLLWPIKPYLRFK